MLEIDIEVYDKKEIPVEFVYEGKTIKACLSFVPGMAGYIWDLHSVPRRDGMAIIYRHYGYLHLHEGYRWVMRIRDVLQPELADYFEAVLISWYQ